MRRREFITLLGGTAVAWPLGADAQPIGKFYRVGWIFPNAPVSEMAGPDPVHLVARAFVHALRDLGYVEGRNLVLVGAFDSVGLPAEGSGLTATLREGALSADPDRSPWYQCQYQPR